MNKINIIYGLTIGIMIFNANKRNTLAERHQLQQYRISIYKVNKKGNIAFCEIIHIFFSILSYFPNGYNTTICISTKYKVQGELNFFFLNQILQSFHNNDQKDF